MAMIASSGVAEGDGSRKAPGQSERSPFARVTELLAPYQPGKPLIMLSLGEPQHPIPAFVGAVLAKGDRLTVRAHSSCDSQVWPEFAASCLRNNVAGAILQARLVTARR